jgi:hypothetical protein
MRRPNLKLPPGRCELILARAFGANLNWAADGQADGLPGELNW